jgi:DNA processing protein
MFRERNRLIAGLAKATLVVEAGVPSGTFSTADAALAANRDVLAIPGSITSPTSAGSNRLIAQGALPIIDDASFESALFLLYGVMVQEGPKTFEAPDDPLLAALNANPMRLEDMLAAGFADDEPSVNRLSKLTIHIAQLERSGLIARFPDGRYGPAAL